MSYVYVLFVTLVRPKEIDPKFQFFFFFHLSIVRGRRGAESQLTVMDVRKIVVIVEDVEVSRTALQWALHNLLRYGDLVTLLHVFPNFRSRSTKKLRHLRLKGFQLALSFQDLCNNFPNVSHSVFCFVPCCCVFFFFFG